MKVYTIGTSNRTLEEFISLLKEYGIKALIDVRRFPTSKFEHFKKENLKENIERAGIEYIHIKELGGYRSGGYLKYTQTEEFKKGLQILLEIARNKQTAIMCSQLLFFRCHRRFISSELIKLGFEVFHILDRKRLMEHR
ncbi:MAG: DUF488 domain-containing protein [Methanocellales archaeon]